MRILYTKTANLYFNELVDILYDKNYFSFKESARMYVDSLTLELEKYIHICPKRKAPHYFSRYGQELWYISYSKNKNTTWYFFFTLHENNTYIIRYITNNHVAGHLLNEELF
ncbi:MAG: hypothetical protein LUE98_01670 [Tannerellaceae bacterium]|nr:hypothetical protein [Tannerellaceae bacterium]